MVKNKTNRLPYYLVITIFLLTSCTSTTPTVQPEIILPSETPQLPTISPTVQPTATVTEVPTATQTPGPTTTPFAYGPSEFPEDINPLTGLQVDDPDLLARRPVMIKVSNFPREGRPHAGLSSADMVFDYSIGEGTNRFLAVFYSQDSDTVGPIRSGRLVDAQLVRLYAGILGYAGADPSLVDPIIQDALGKRAYSRSDATCPALCDRGFPSVFSVFADTKQLTDLAASSYGVQRTRYDLDGMFFSSLIPEDGSPADVISVVFNYYNRAEWKYDQANGKYLRWIEEVDPDNNLKMIPLVDRNNDQQLAFSNLIIMFSHYSEYAPTLHDIDIWNNSQGKPAVLFRDGQKFEINWKTSDKETPIQFVNDDESPAALKPGNTWVVIVGEKSILDEVSSGQWNVTFSIP